VVCLFLSPPDFFLFFSPSQDGFGPFSDPSGGTVNNNNDTFTFSSSFSDEDSSFDSFGDFGDFQTAEDHDGGSLTPTSGSWTFANEVGGSVDSISISNISSSGGGGGGSVEGGSSSKSSLAAR
jgi:hypothetical protein